MELLEGDGPAGVPVQGSEDLQAQILAEQELTVESGCKEFAVINAAAAVDVDAF